MDTHYEFTGTHYRRLSKDNQISLPKYWCEDPDPAITLLIMPPIFPGCKPGGLRRLILFPLTEINIKALYNTIQLLKPAEDPKHQILLATLRSHAKSIKAEPNLIVLCKIGPSMKRIALTQEQADFLGNNGDNCLVLIGSMIYLSISKAKDWEKYASKCRKGSPRPHWIDSRPGPEKLPPQ